MRRELLSTELLSRALLRSELLKREGDLFSREVEELSRELDPVKRPAVLRNRSGRRSSTTSLTSTPRNSRKQIILERVSPSDQLLVKDEKRLVPLRRLDERFKPREISGVRS